MKDDQFAEELAAALLAESPAVMTTGPLSSAAALGDVFKRLRALSVPWLKIIALIGPVIQILMSGGTFQEIMAKIIELFFPPAPGATAMAAAKA